MKLLGPWGGAGGSNWSFNEDGLSIKQIVINHGVSIDSITFKYDRFGKIECSKFGGSGGTRDQIDFGPDEYLTSISGYASGYVNSLKLVTNLKQYGPYGPEEGSSFTVPIQDGTIVGFFGRSGNMLDAIGVYLKSVGGSATATGILCTSVYGGPGGYDWSWNGDGKATIKRIVIGHGRSIDSITFTYELGGISFFSAHGGSGGEKSQIDFQPHEYLTGVSGYYRAYVNALKLVTNVKEYGPFGSEDGSPFHLEPPMKDGKIVGFYGRSGTMIDAIGAYIAPPKPSLVAFGPWGGLGGDNWAVNESGNGIIRQIIVSEGSSTVSFSLMFKVEVNGVVECSGDFGASGDTKHKIDFHPNEYLTRITGYEGRVVIDKAYVIVRSIKFYTNIGEYGPYGHEEGTPFTSPTGKIVGMFGKSGTLLDAVGVYMLPA